VPPSWLRVLRLRSVFPTPSRSLGLRDDKKQALVAEDTWICFPSPLGKNSVGSCFSRSPERVPSYATSFGFVSDCPRHSSYLRYEPSSPRRLPCHFIESGHRHCAYRNGRFVPCPYHPDSIPSSPSRLAVTRVTASGQQSVFFSGEQWPPVFGPWSNVLLPSSLHFPGLHRNFPPMSSTGLLKGLSFLGRGSPPVERSCFLGRGLLEVGSDSTLPSSGAFPCRFQKIFFSPARFLSP